MNNNDLTHLLRSKPLTKSVPDAIRAGVEVDEIIDAATRSLGYTRRGVLLALRRAGRPVPRPTRKP
jgi:hypothetical protein